jgi:predicted metal-dependent phosphoesterase TrpH
MKFDLHVHTNLSSCSSLTPEEILQHAKLRGLDGVCVTDHNTMGIRHHIAEGMQPDGLCVIFGMEYDTPDGDFLIFGPFEELAPGMPARQLLQTVAAVGGAAVAAHPFRRGRPVSEYVFREGLCGIVENRNGRNTRRENLQADVWLEKYALTPCAGSDAHELCELGCITTRFGAGITSRADLIRALKAGMVAVRPAVAA